MIEMPFEKLKIWQKSMNLALIVYRVTSAFPKGERFGLVSQMRRCAISVPSNIAEGSQRKSNKDFVNFILIAKGSLAELRTQILLSKELTYIENDKGLALVKDIIEIDKMLHAFSKKLV